MQQDFLRISCLLFISLSFLLQASGQDRLSFDLKKPEKYENKPLGSEKTTEKKFSASRRFVQNTVTHFNWYYNANNKLNEIIERAKSVHEDDYSQLLTFYNYSIEATARDSMELDSVIFKSNAGILIHDLRNAWIDNLYMLMGQAYFFRNRLDSAYVIFQFLNYAFAPMEKDGYQQPIGSNASEGGNAFNISTKEKNGLLRRALTTPPSRNDALIWQVKTFLENGEYTSAAALIETLRLDPNLPERLQPSLNEVRALLHYKMKSYDSAAYYLQHALPNAQNKAEQARWEYLVAQLYERAGKAEAAQQFYEKAISHTLDPVMEVYARLNTIRQNRGDSAAIDRNVAELAKMGRKERYSRYRDIIYFTAAQIELERNNTVSAKQFLLRSTRYSDPERNSGMKGKAFMQLGDLSYKAREYADARRFYDSVSAGDPVITDPEAFVERSDMLARIVAQQEIIRRQDSLKRLAAMPEAEREAFVRKKYRELRKAQGMQEEETPGISAGSAINPAQQTPDELFAAQKGEWYFYNASVKSKGFTAFKAKWGNRPNADNWRRVASINAAQAAAEFDPGMLADGKGLEVVNTELSYEAMLKSIPLTPEQQTLVEDSIQNASVDLGDLYMNGLEDYFSVTSQLNKFPEEYAKSERLPEALYYLYYSYRQMGDEERANAMLRMLQDKFAGNPFERRISNAVNRNEVVDKDKEMTVTYNRIYNLFIEGRFDQALSEKKMADSIYGQHYWTPQLLYIESIYHIRQRNDEDAVNVLELLVNTFPDSPMKEKAETMLDVLSRRAEIEEYLTKLDITRPLEDSPAPRNDTAAIARVDPPAEEEDAEMEEEIEEEIVSEETPPTPVEPEPKTTKEIPTAVITKKDSAAINVKVEPVTPKQPKREVVATEVKTNQPVIPPGTAPPVVKATDSARIPVPPATTGAYSYAPASAHLVVVITNNVDPVYVNESRNAFNRYNQANYYNKKIDINSVALTDTIKMVVMSGFVNSAEALQYLNKIAPIAATSIVPWLPAEKYSFLLISEQNLEVLKRLRSIPEYLQFQRKNYRTEE